MCETSVLDPIPPPSQHCPICVSINPVIVAHPITFRRRFNLKNADWNGFSADLDSNIEEINAIPGNYDRPVEILCMASRKHISRGYWSNYIPGLTDESKSLYEAYKKQYSIDPFGETTIDTGVTAQSIRSDQTIPWYKTGYPRVYSLAQIMPPWQNYAQVHLIKFLDALIGKAPQILLLTSLNLSY